LKPEERGRWRERRKEGGGGENKKVQGSENGNKHVFFHRNGG